MIWVVLDTNVLVSGLGWRRGASARIVDAAVEGRFVLVTSRPLLTELGRVLRYRKLKNVFPHPSRVVELVEEISIVVSPGTKLTVLTDDDDNRVLEAAGAARADFLVSGDAGMLALGPEHDGIRVMNPADFLVEFTLSASTKVYKAMIWIPESDVRGRRVTVHAQTLAEAKEKLEAQYGKGNVFSLHNMFDASRPR